MAVRVVSMYECIRLDLDDMEVLITSEVKSEQEAHRHTKRLNDMCKKQGMMSIIWIYRKQGDTTSFKIVDY